MPSSATKFADVKAAPLSRRSADIRHGLTYGGKSLPLRQRLICARDPAWSRAHKASRPDHGIHRVSGNRPAKPAAYVRFRSDDGSPHSGEQDCRIRVPFGFGRFGRGVPTPQRRKVPGRFVVKDEPIINKRTYTRQAGSSALQPSPIPSELEPKILTRRLTVLSQVI